MGQWPAERVGGRKKGETRKERRGEGQGLPPPTPALKPFLECPSHPESPVMPPVSAQEGEDEDRSHRRRRALKAGLRQRETRREA